MRADDNDLVTGMTVGRRMTYNLPSDPAEKYYDLLHALQPASATASLYTLSSKPEILITIIIGVIFSFKKSSLSLPLSLSNSLTPERIRQERIA